jgi:hypothetical protein
MKRMIVLTAALATLVLVLTMCDKLAGVVDGGGNGDGE